MADREWTMSLKAGDVVAIYGGDRHGEATIATIERTTRTQIIVDGARFNRDGGYCRNRRGHWAEWIDRPDVAERRTLIEKIRKGFICNYSWDRSCTTAELSQIAEIVEAAQARSEQARKDA